MASPKAQTGESYSTFWNAQSEQRPHFEKASADHQPSDAYSDFHTAIEDAPVVTVMVVNSNEQ
jgi:hypothetical protein